MEEDENGRRAIDGEYNILVEKLLLNNCSVGKSNYLNYNKLTHEEMEYAQKIKYLTEI